MADQKSFADKYEVPYPLLADPEKAMASAYGVLGGSGYAGRSTFLIGSDGTIKKVWPKVTPAGHAAEIVAALKALGS